MSHKIIIKKILILKIVLLITIKLQLREEKVNEEIKKIIPEAQCLELSHTQNMPLLITKWLTKYFKELEKNNIINQVSLINLEKQLQ